MRVDLVRQDLRIQHLRGDIVQGLGSVHASLHAVLHSMHVDIQSRNTVLHSIALFVYSRRSRCACGSGMTGSPNTAPALQFSI